MLFNSIEFLLFFPVATLTFFLIPHRFRWIHLLLLSCVFYGAFIPSYLLILFLLILIDYSAGILIERSRHKKLLLLLSIISNIGLLGIFKYYDFFIANINEATGTQFLLLHWILPIGLSFHTFQSLSYTIEVYKGKQQAIRHLGYYGLYVMFYPQLVAGPIERPQHLLPQLMTERHFSWQQTYEGLRLMCWGFFKKVVIADRIAAYVNPMFGEQDGTGVAALLGVFLFSIQIYADFSGYSDIAIGAARCMGIDLSLNFNRPYQSKNIKAFWQRWHISLSSWFKSYVYIPLGGNKVSPVRHKFNILVTFALSGFWHGASWNFMIWGLLHGVYTLLYEGINRQFNSVKIPGIIAWAITMLLVGFGWIFFRTADFEDALHYIHNIFDLTNSSGSFVQQVEFFGLFNLTLSFLFIGFMFLIERNTDSLLLTLNKMKLVDMALFVVVLWLVVFFGVFNKSGFIYFQF